jgi:predicted nuclease with RNAse H fold
MSLVLGIDVGVRKGLDLVLLDDHGRLTGRPQRIRLDGLRAAIEASRPDVICIDSPPAFGKGQPRATEVAIRRLGINLYATPWETAKQANRFYDWMRAGQEVFRIAEMAGYPLFDGLHRLHRALEIFPYGAAVVLSGTLRPRGLHKDVWRRRTLAAQGVETGNLRSPDQVDAALAAVTGVRVLEGCFCYLGDPVEGAIVLPCSRESLPLKYTRPGT